MAPKRAKNRRRARRRRHVGNGRLDRSQGLPDAMESRSSPDDVERSVPPADEFHVTVASLSMAGASLELSVEIEMAKAALLYADRVTLASPKTVFLLSAAELAHGEEETRIDATLQMLQEVGDVPVADIYRRLENKRDRTPDELRMLTRLRSVVQQASQGVQERLGPMLESSRLDELAPAVEAGILDFEPLGAGELDAGADDFFEHMLEALVDLLRSSISPTASAHPMYDDSAGDLLKAMLREGHIDDPVIELANEIGVARGLIGTVEAFPHASMDVVLDVRERLKGPLVRFRAAVATASRQLAEGDSVLDARFHARVREIYRRTVAPELKAIEESLDELKALPTLRRIAPSVAESGARGAVGTGLALLTGALDEADFAALAVAAGAGAKAAAEERAFRAEAERQRKQNRFFWLYEANRQLGR